METGVKTSFKNDNNHYKKLIGKLHFCAKPSKKGK